MRKSEFSTKYTKTTLAPIVAESLSIAEVLRKLGRPLSGSMYRWIPEIIERHGIDTSHFLGNRRNSGRRHVGGAVKLAWPEVLVYDRLNGHKEDTFRLRRAMIEAGIDHSCAVCGLTNLWMNRPLTLQIEHRNGNPLDNRQANLCFLCPNCHSQTETHSVTLSARRTNAQMVELVDTQV